MKQSNAKFAIGKHLSQMISICICKCHGIKIKYWYLMNE